MIEISSYKSINGITFGSSESDVISFFGQPIRHSKNSEKEAELHFPSFILRFDSVTGQLREASLLPKCDAVINGKLIIWDENFLFWLASEDQDLVEVLGFVISLKLGIAVSGFHDNDESQKAVHAFRHGDWDMFRNRMRPFSAVGWVKSHQPNMHE